MKPLGNCEECIAFGDSAALQADFFSTSAKPAPLVAPPVKKPVPTKNVWSLVKDAKAQKDAQYAANRRQMQADALKVQAIHSKPGGFYDDKREQQKLELEVQRKLRECMQRRGAECSYAWDTSLDLGLIPMGIKVVGTGAAIIATGGALAAGAGGLAAGLGAAGSGILSADKLIAAAQKAPAAAKQAKQVIDNTVKLATSGNASAQAGLNLLNAVASDRTAKGVPPGVEQTPKQLSSLASALVAPGAVRTAAARLSDGEQNVIRFTVSEEGRIIRGAVSNLKGWRVYDSGKVARQ